ncbi:MAG: hypothetical protein MRJ96_04875 [Nitrospirales bacterium]|nr:hypothetical protein [Nitrospira sp.]MDR4500773.1 hypothetical protein [Nitrospirales bacterium]
MIKIFCGMILGSLSTMMLLGGAPVAEKVLQNAQATFGTPTSQMSPALTIYLLAFLAIYIIYFANSMLRQHQQTDLIIKKLRRISSNTAST